MEEKELVRLSKDGNKEAFAALVKKYKTKVFNLAWSLTRDREMADDLAQEAFIKAYFALSKFQFKSEFGTWLYRITVNHVKDYLRKKRKMSKISIDNIKESSFFQEDRTVSKEKELERERRKKFVHHFIRTLPEKHQIILLQGYSRASL